MRRQPYSIPLAGPHGLNVSMRRAEPTQGMTRRLRGTARLGRAGLLGTPRGYTQGRVGLHASQQAVRPGATRSPDEAAGVSHPSDTMLPLTTAPPLPLNFVGTTGTTRPSWSPCVEGFMPDGSSPRDPAPADREEGLQPDQSIRCDTLVPYRGNNTPRSRRTPGWTPSPGHTAGAGPHLAADTGGGRRHVIDWALTGRATNGRSTTRFGVAPTLCVCRPSRRCASRVGGCAGARRRRDQSPRLLPLCRRSVRRRDETGRTSAPGSAARG
jgi:hypothetical protein